MGEVGLTGVRGPEAPLPASREERGWARGCQANLLAGLLLGQEQGLAAGHLLRQGLLLSEAKRIDRFVR
jgi:hypothetical protein